MSFSRTALATAATSLLGLGLSFPAAAQTTLAPDSPPVDNTVVVTATRVPERIDAQLSDVTVLTRADIEAAGGGHTLVELLGEQPGIAFIQNGGLGTSSAISIRGDDVRHTLLIIDGVRYGSATLGQPVFDNIPLDSIERIEIVRGPMSSLYGSEAGSGVIQIFTRGGEAGVHPNASIGGGSEGFGEVSAGVRFGSGPWSGSVQAQHQQDHGFSATNANVPFGNYNADDDGFKQDSVNAALGYKINADWQVNAHALRSEGKVAFDDGVPFDDTTSNDAKSKLTTQVLAADVTGRILPIWRSTLRVASSLDIYNTVSAAQSFDIGEFRTRQNQATWENSFDTAIGTVLALGDHVTQKVYSSTTAYDVTDRTINAVALGLDGRHGIHNWQFSGRHDDNSQFGSINTGNAAYAIDFLPQWRAGVSYGTSFTAPSFNELYYPGFGNHDLLPERGRNREASLRWRPNDQHQVSLTGYSNRVRDFITLDNTNVPEAKLDGATLAYQGHLYGWTVGGSVDALNSRGTDVNGVDQPLPRRAHTAFKLIADRTVGTWGVGGTLLTASDRHDSTSDENFNTVPVTMGGYATADLRAHWDFYPDFTLQAHLNNIADHRYETAYGYNQGGREFFLTLRWAPK